jgi:hypothetical protein
MSAYEQSRWLRRGDGLGAAALGMAVGRLASGRLGGPLMARLGSVRPFVFLRSFKSYNVAGRRGRARAPRRWTAWVASHPRVIVSARDVVGEGHRWQRLLDPTQPADFGFWQRGDGPALRLVKGPEDAIQAVVWEVSSLGTAAEWLKERLARNFPATTKSQ